MGWGFGIILQNGIHSKLISCARERLRILSWSLKIMGIDKSSGLYFRLINNKIGRSWLIGYRTN